MTKQLDQRVEKPKPDFYINKKGLTVFTADYHLKRGYCCKNKCLHCPYS